MQKIILIPLILIGFMGTAHARGIEQIQEHTFQVMDGSLLQVHVSDANVNILGRDEGTEASITVIKTAKRMSQEEADKAFKHYQIICEKNEEGIIVTSERPTFSSKVSFLRKGQMAIDIEITMPRNSNIDVKTSDGNLVLSQFNGSINLKTSDGDIATSDINGDIQLKSSDGDILADAINGAIKARSSDGDIKITHSVGPLMAQTSDGDLIIEGQHGELNATTSDGDIIATVTESPTKNCNIKTSDGNVILKVGEEVSVNVHARVNDGHIKIDHSNVQLEDSSNRNMRVKLNGGGNTISVKTSDGDIIVQPLKK